MSDSSHTDEALLLSGEPEDFGRFYDRYVRSLLAYFQRRTRDPEVAADLTAETFAAALAARGRFRPRATPASVWLFAIAHHKLMDFHRRGSAEDRMRFEGYDLQALGMILWEMICGHPVFPYRDPALFVVLRREATLVREASLPAAVRRWLLDCLATPSEFTPDQRFFLR